MAQPSGKGRNARTGGWAHLVGLFFTILVVELVLDIVLLPADEVLVPGELIGDALFLAVAVGGTIVSGSGSGRPIRTPRSRSLRRRNRRGTTGFGAATVLGYWVFVIAILLFQWWFSVHHPILQILFFVFEVVFDVLLFMGGVLVTLLALVGGPAGYRQVGS
ncbi:MAG: hypothetical protein ACRDV4_12480 [Acidimicrobiales bacterium]